MLLSASTFLLNPQPQPSRFFSLLPTTTTTTTSLSLSSSSSSSSSLKLFPPKPPSFSLSSDDFVIGDCVVFEDGAFDDPYLLHDDEEETLAKPENKNAQNKKEVPTENLVPDKWREVQAEINITKKERRKIARELEFGTRVEKKRSGLAPLKNVNLEDYLAFREAKLAQLKPLVLDNPEGFGNGEEEDEKEEEGFGNGEKKENSSGRVNPRNPRWAVYGKGFDDVTEFFNGDNYDPAERKSQGPRKLFSKEEKVLLNKRIPDLETATSEKWPPLHTLAASGAFYLVDTLLKHNVDINAVDKDGCTAIHKAIIGKKQAITNYLLRESANPFVRDKDGATLMHYAVRTASSQAIKILLLYNVDINLQDNDGWTPLHLAVQAKKTDVVKLLLIKGADKTLKNKDGLTPLDLCLYSGGDTRTYELIKLLKLLPKQR